MSGENGRETELDRVLAEFGAEQEQWERYWASLTPEERECERAMMDTHTDERRGGS